MVLYREPILVATGRPNGRLSDTEQIDLPERDFGKFIVALYDGEEVQFAGQLYAGGNIPIDVVTHSHILENLGLAGPMLQGVKCVLGGGRLFADHADSSVTLDGDSDSFGSVPALLLEEALSGCQYTPLIEVPETVIPGKVDGLDMYWLRRLGFLD